MDTTPLFYGHFICATQPRRAQEISFPRLWHFAHKWQSGFSHWFSLISHDSRAIYGLHSLPALLLPHVLLFGEGLMDMAP
jgi:hypothetical protein